MFYFIVKNLRWLARVPGLPQFFDALLVAGTCAFRNSRVRAMENLEREVLRLPGVRLKNHRFGGWSFSERTATNSAICTETDFWMCRQACRQRRL